MTIFRRRVTMSIVSFAYLCGFLSQCSPGYATDSDSASSLHGKMIVGYQGWFGCPGDFRGNKLWDHWSFKKPDSENLIVDLLPQTDEFNRQDLCVTDWSRPDGSKMCLYSCLNGNIVDKHFQWMAQYGIDGAAFQRFIAEIAYPAGLERRDQILRNVRHAAEKSGCVFYITYDISGANPATVCDDITRDWQHLVHGLKITDSPSYLKHHGKPVLQIWGFGFNDRPGEPEPVKQLLQGLKAGRNNLPAVTLIGGVPTCWRTLMGDSKRDSAWADVYRTYDVISPWTVNRFADELGADLFVKFMVSPDIAEAKRHGLEYMPVIFPGFSWYNLMHSNHRDDKAIFNRVPRVGGKFYYKQIHGLLGAHVNMLFAAMFDEVNEGTAIFKVETRAGQFPRGAKLLYPKLDGADVPPDWYLRITGLAARYLKSGKQPPEQLELTPGP